MGTLEVLTECAQGAQVQAQNAQAQNGQTFRTFWEALQHVTGCVEFSDLLHTLGICGDLILSKCGGAFYMTPAEYAIARALKWRALYGERWEALEHVLFADQVRALRRALNRRLSHVFGCKIRRLPSRMWEVIHTGAGGQIAKRPASVTPSQCTQAAAQLRAKAAANFGREFRTYWEALREVVGFTCLRDTLEKLGFSAQGILQKACFGACLTYHEAVLATALLKTSENFDDLKGLDLILSRHEVTALRKVFGQRLKTLANCRIMRLPSRMWAVLPA